MVNAKIASKIKISPYIFLATKNDGSDTVLKYKIKSKGFENKRDFECWEARRDKALKLAAHFNILNHCDNKADIFELVCSIAELEYGTDYLCKRRYGKAILGRAYIFWILKNVFGFGVTEIGKCFNKDHSSVINGIDRFNKLSSVCQYQEYKLVKTINNILQDNV